MFLGLAKAHISELLEGVLQGEGAAVFESEASRSCPHSASALFSMDGCCVVESGHGFEDWTCLVKKSLLSALSKIFLLGL